MLKESLKVMLETICKYNTVEIKHTFSKNNQPFFTVRCLKGTRTLEITYLDTQVVEHYDNLEEVAEVMLLLINEEATSKA